MGKVLLFYKYTPFEYPERIRKWQTKVCQELNLTGRIIIAHEGINGTVGGSEQDIEHYKRILQAHPQLEDIDIKESLGGADCFDNLKVVVKNEIVHIGLKDHAQIKNSGAYLTPDQVHALLINKPDDLIILDARNMSESAIGAFQGAIKPNITHFRELPHYIDKHAERFKDKEVLMYCTGGVRCERATAYLKEKKIAKQVYHLQGGIHRYVEQYPDGYFRGKNYVFDKRIALKANDDILSSCSLCSVSCDNYNNCLNALCNKHYISCDQCLITFNQCCSPGCKELIATHKVKQRPTFHKVTVTQ